MASFSATSLPPGVEAGVDAGSSSSLRSTPANRRRRSAVGWSRPPGLTAPRCERFPRAIASPTWAAAWASRPNSTFLPASATFDPELCRSSGSYPGVVTLRVELWRASRDSVAAELWRLDASDLMLAPVGSTAFWRAMVDYLDEGPESAEGIEAGLEAAWPPDDP